MVFGLTSLDSCSTAWIIRHSNGVPLNDAMIWLTQVIHRKCHDCKPSQRFLLTRFLCANKTQQSHQSYWVPVVVFAFCGFHVFECWALCNEKKKKNIKIDKVENVALAMGIFRKSFVDGRRHAMSQSLCILHYICAHVRIACGCLKIRIIQYHILLRSSDSVLRRIRRSAMSESEERPSVKQKTKQWIVQSNPTFDNLIIRSN